MSVPFCHLCESNPGDARSHHPNALQEGEYCPVCLRPTCRRHLSTVRWRWKSNGALDAALVCLECKNAYRHRAWDPVHRDWIS